MKTPNNLFSFAKMGLESKKTHEQNVTRVAVKRAT